MTLLDQLQAHKGGLVLIKSELFWCYDRGWDGVPGRLCLLLDTAVLAACDAATTTATTGAPRYRAVAALLLVDGTPRWVWMVAEDVELIDGGDQ